MERFILDFYGIGLEVGVWFWEGVISFGGCWVKVEWYC